MYLDKKLFYPIKKHLIDGSTSSVFLGKYNETQVCIKQYKPHITESEILNEASILISLPANSFLCFIVGVCLDQPKRLVTSFFGSEFPAKSTLDYNIKSKDLSVNNSLLVITKLLSAVDFLHDHKVYHGDIKPNNILVSFKSINFNLKVIDFGCASFISTDDDELYKSLVENDEVKLICRCNKHTAPEVHYGFPRSKYTDIYGVGYSLTKVLSIHQEFFSNSKYKNFSSLLKTCKQIFPYSRPSLYALCNAFEECVN